MVRCVGRELRRARPAQRRLRRDLLCCLRQPREQIETDIDRVPIIDQASEEQRQQVGLVEMTEEIVLLGIDRDADALGKIFPHEFEGERVFLVASRIDEDELCGTLRRAGAEQVGCVDRSFPSCQPSGMPGSATSHAYGTAGLQQRTEAQGWKPTQTATERDNPLIALCARSSSIRRAMPRASPSPLMPRV